MTEEITHINDLHFLSKYEDKYYYTSASGGLIWHRFMFSNDVPELPAHIFKSSNS